MEWKFKMRNRTILKVLMQGFSKDAELIKIGKNLRSFNFKTDKIALDKKRET